MHVVTYFIVQNSCYLIGLASLFFHYFYVLGLNLKKGDPLRMMTRNKPFFIKSFSEGQCRNDKLNIIQSLVVFKFSLVQ